jgi:Periplasmic binding protein
VDLLIGPYGSGLVRAIVPLVRDSGRILWNHGGSADDLAQPGIACLLAPASSYFDGVVDEAADRKVSRIIVVQASGPFAHAVAAGARARASEHGIDSQAVEASAVEGEDVTETAVLVAGPFEHDAAVVRELRDRGQSPALLAAVAAGISAFGRELGRRLRVSWGRCTGGRPPTRRRSGHRVWTLPLEIGAGQGGNPRILLPSRPPVGTLLGQLMAWG